MQDAALSVRTATQDLDQAFLSVAILAQAEQSQLKPSPIFVAQVTKLSLTTSTAMPSSDETGISERNEGTTVIEPQNPNP